MALISHPKHDAPVSVKQKEGEEEVPTEILASAIVEISRAMKALETGRLGRRALVLLIHDACNGVGKPAINAVLGVLPDLEKRYCRPRKK